jgi:hypothetical protein
MPLERISAGANDSFINAVETGSSAPPAFSTFGFAVGNSKPTATVTWTSLFPTSGTAVAWSVVAAVAATLGATNPDGTISIGDTLITKLGPANGGTATTTGGVAGWTGTALVGATTGKIFSGASGSGESLIRGGMESGRGE